MSLKEAMQRRHLNHRFEQLDARIMLAFDSLVISELMAANRSVLADEDGDFSDWLEIHNPTSESVSLAGWSLTDDAEERQKWPLPEATLVAGDYQVVFASGKDRQSPESSWHTNFRLRAEGEFLALVDPSGEISHEYSPQYPQQSSDVAFGLISDQTLLLAEEGASRFFVPSKSDAGLDWTAPDFDDSTWAEASGVVGFDQRQGIPNVGFESGAFDEWRTRGETSVARDFGDPPQGEYHALLVANGESPTRFSLESFLGQSRSTLNEVGNGVVTRGSVIRRELEVQAGSQLEFDWNFLTDEPRLGPASNDFSFFSVSPDIGVIPLGMASTTDQESATSFAWETGYQRFRYTFAEAGSYRIGFGVVNVENPFLDSGLLIDNLTVDGIGSLSDTFDERITTNLETDFSAADSSLWRRQEFEIDDPNRFVSFVLNATYDEGMVVHLNGEKVVRRNAPANVVWNSLAPEARPDAEAIQPESIALPIELFKSGRNVLAVQGLKQSADDESFLLGIELIGLSPLAEVPAYLPTATPGAANLTDGFRTVGEVDFSVEHGFFEEPFELTLTSTTPNASIIYTLDGSEPTLQNGDTYSAPLTIGKSTVVRAGAFREDLVAARVGTSSYLFIDDVLEQSRRTSLQRGFPADWRENVVDYAMDPRIIGQNGVDRYGGRYADTVRDDLKALPTLSLVMDVDDLFGSRGIYSNPLGRGVQWERPTSVELIDPQGDSGFQVDAGIRIQGGISRFISSKNSLRLLFKEQYGAAKLEYPLFGPDAASTFDSISLRSSSGEHLVGVHYIRDEFLRRSQLETGNLSSHGRYMHLYINGVYWGMYNPVERIDGQFAANYFGGEKEDYDVLNAGDLGNEGVSPVIGSLNAWNTAVDLARAVSSARNEDDRSAAYLRLQGRNPDGSNNEEWENYLDVDNFIDYLITNLYARNTDWPVRNYYMLRKLGSESEGFQFFVWDAEFTLDMGDRSSISQMTSEGPGILYELLQNSEAFRVDFSDRAQLHFSQGGAFYVNPENREHNLERPQDNVPAARYSSLAEEIRSPIVPETARWGDERGRTGIVFTRDEIWQRTIDQNLDQFFPLRSRDFLRDLRRNGFYREAPAVSLPGGAIDAGSQVVIISADAGSIYFTLDGSDPRNPDGSISDAAIASGEAVIDRAVTLSARSFNGSKWSALVSVDYFTAAVPADQSNLRISELNYNPHDALIRFGEFDVDNDEFEFVELVNVADRSVDLAGAAFVRRDGEGITFEFGEQQLSPGQRVVIPNNPAAFVSRYGENVLLATGVADSPADWRYDGKLSNGGERLVLVDARGQAIVDFRFDDGPGWPGRADGNGSSLELIDPTHDLDDLNNYRNSSEYGGSPGIAGLGPDNRVVINEVLANDEAGDRLELFNRTGDNIDLSGWYLSDSPGEFDRYQFPEAIEISARGYLQLAQEEFSFGLSSVQGDDVYLIEAAEDGRPGRFVDRVEFNATDAGVSLGRWPDAEGRLFPMREMSFGAANTGPLSPPLLISEVHYNPADPDDNGPLDGQAIQFVELHNPTELPLNLGSYSLDGSIEFAFSDSTTLEPGKTLIVANYDPELDLAQDTLFRLVYTLQLDAKVVGPFTGELGVDTAIIRLEREPVGGEDDPENSTVLVDRVEYSNQQGWPQDLNGTGQSLNRVATDAYGDFSASWTSLLRSPGTVDFSVLAPGDVNGDGRIDVSDVDQLCAAIHDQSEDPRYDLNRDQELTRDDHRFLIEEILGTSAGDANLDGTFNSQDLVLIFTNAEYEDDVEANSSWFDGDWNCDREFTSSDLVMAFQAGRYTEFPAPAARPATLWGRTASELIKSEPDNSPIAASLLQNSGGKGAENPLHGEIRQVFASQPSSSPIVHRDLTKSQDGLQTSNIDRLFEHDADDTL